MSETQYENIPASARVLGYFIPVGTFLVGAYFYNERKRRLGRKAARASDLDYDKAKYKLAYQLAVAELAGVETTLYPSLGQTIRINAGAPVGTQWQAHVEPASALRVDHSDKATAGVGGHTQVFNFTLRELTDARVTLTAIGPGNQVVDSVTFDVDAQE